MSRSLTAEFANASFPFRNATISFCLGALVAGLHPAGLCRLRSIAITLLPWALSGATLGEEEFGEHGFEKTSPGGVLD